MLSTVILRSPRFISFISVLAVCNTIYSLLFSVFCVVYILFCCLFTVARLQFNDTHILRWYWSIYVYIHIDLHVYMFVTYIRIYCMRFQYLLIYVFQYWLDIFIVCTWLFVFWSSFEIPEQNIEIINSTWLKYEVVNLTQTNLIISYDLFLHWNILVKKYMNLMYSLIEEKLQVLKI